MTKPSNLADPIFLSDDEIEAMLSDTSSSAPEVIQDNGSDGKEPEKEPDKEESDEGSGDPETLNEETEEEDEDDNKEPTEAEIDEIEGSLQKIDSYGDLSEEEDDDFFSHDEEDAGITEDTPPIDYDESEFEDLEAAPLSRSARMKLPPRDMEDFFVREEERIRRLSAKFGIPFEEQDDFWMEVCSKFCRESTLGKFDPEKGAKWPTFLYRVVQNFASYYRKSLKKDINRSAVAIIRDPSEAEGGSSKDFASTMDLIAFQISDADPVPERAVQKVIDSQMEEYLHRRSLNPEGSFFYGDWVQELLTNPVGGESEVSRREQTNQFLDNFQMYLEELVLFEDPSTMKVRKGVPRKVRPSAVRVRKAIPHHESLSRTFKMLRQGMTQSAIAERMNVVISSITNYKRKIREEAGRFCEMEVC